MAAPWRKLTHTTHCAHVVVLLVSIQQRHQTRAVASTLERYVQEEREEALVVGGADRALCCFTKTNIVRRRLQMVVKHRAFDGSVYVLIGISCVLLAVDTPYHGTIQALADMLYYCDGIITGFFVIEALIKMAAYGLVAGSGTYLRNGWNVRHTFSILHYMYSLCSTILHYQMFTIPHT